MIAELQEFAQRCFSGPNMVASVLLICVCLYWLMTIVGGLGLDFDFDFDMDGDVSEGLTGLGFVSLRWLNLADVPLMIWLTVFGVSLWLLTLTLDFMMPSGHDSLGRSFLIVLRNGAITVFLTKVLTQPLKGMTRVREPNPVEDLIDKEGVANTEISTRHGQLRYELDGAPLLLNARTETGSLGKGELARIIDFDPHTRVYLVAKVEKEVPQ